LSNNFHTSARVPFQYAPSLLVIAATGALLAWLVHLVRAANQGHLTYVLDDPYIALAIGRSLGLHGVWGVTPAGFTNCSSSPAWTLLLAAAARVGLPLEMLPFVLAALGAAAAVIVLDRILRDAGTSIWVRTIVLAIAAAAAPLAPLVFTGLEHTTHIAAISLAAWLAAGTLVDRGKTIGTSWPLLLAALVASAARFESLFLVGAVCAALLWQRRFPLAVALFVAGTLPVALLAIAGVAHGWGLLPTSIRLKGNDPRVGLTGFLMRFGSQAVTSPPLIVVLIVCVSALLVDRQRQLAPRIRAFTGLVIVMTVAHLMLGGVGWFYRYEAYLIALCAIAAGMVLPKGGPRDMLRWPGALVTVIAVAAAGLLLGRAIDSIKSLPLAAAGIYRQQYQMARLLRSSYAHQSVVLNDIGATTYLGEIEPVDIAGLANIDIARARLAKTFGPETIRTVAAKAGAQIAVVYDAWYWEFGGLPREWILVRRWRTRCWICGNETVSFYGFNEPAASRLRAALDAFEPTLPDGIVVTP
jgi:hypothetical protein